MSTPGVDPTNADRRSERTTQLWFAALALLHVLIVWSVPILPAQDLPQHLAYAAILADSGAGSGLFKEFYQRPPGLQSYYTLHYVLAALARFMDVESAGRLAFTAYVISFFLTFRSLARLHAPSREADVVSLGASAFVWGSVACMGFVSFLFAIPAVLGGTAAFIRLAKQPLRGWKKVASSGALAAAAVVMSSLHVVATVLFALFVLLYGAFARSANVYRAMVTALLCCLIPRVLWLAAGDSELVARPILFREAINNAFAFEFVTEAFDITWRDPLAKLGYVFWNVLGPYRLPGQLFTFTLVAILFVWFRESTTAAKHRPPEGSPDRAFVSASRVLLLAGLVAPWGFYRPSEVTFLDFRIIAVAICFLATAVNVRWMATSRGVVHVVGGCCLALTVHFAARAFAFGTEALPALRLLEDAKPAGALLPLTFHNRSNHFGKQFRLTHFLPMYYTVRQHGISTQFWARYTEHLPIDYKPGKRPHAPPDWRPWELTTSHLRSVDFVLLQRATPDNSRQAIEGSRSAEALLNSDAHLVRCDGLWCLYRTRRSS